MQIIINWIIAAVAILIAAYLVPGIAVTGFVAALIVALVLGIINAVIKPILVLLTLPINVLTLGLFTWVINAVLVMLAAYVVPGFSVSGFWAALIFGLVLAIINWLAGLIDNK